MPSRALRAWQTRSRKVLDEIEAAHAVVGGARRARAFARQQINQAYVVVLASHFQLFCRDLHSDCVDALSEHPPFALLAPVFEASLSAGIRLSQGNATSGNITTDFGRLGVNLWTLAAKRDVRLAERREKLDALNRWRNAFAHQDFRNAQLRSRQTVRLREVRSWRAACDRLAVDFDAALRLYLESITGKKPW